MHAHDCKGLSDNTRKQAYLGIIYYSSRNTPGTLLTSQPDSRRENIINIPSFFSFTVANSFNAKSKYPSLISSLIFG